MPDKKTKQGNNSGVKMLLVLLLAAIWLLAIFMLALLLAPRVGAIPEFEISDKNGDWQAQGTVAVFDDTIYPGTEGEYNFVVRSLSTGDLKYYFYMEEHYTGKEEWKSFMQYRIKMNGKHIENDEWHSIDELNFDNAIVLAQTRQLFTSEWRWPFESGNDGNDTSIGIHSGSYSVIFHLYAEVIDEVVG